MDLRNHQKQCIDNIHLHFENENKALIKMFCGSGKSFVIYHCLLQYTNNLSVVVVPSINLITQFNKDYLLDKDKKEYNNTYFNKSFEILTVCSKNELDQNIKITTDKEYILEFLKKDIFKIVLITYQSLELLVNVIKENDFMVDLLCFDEAHHIVGNNMKELLFGLDTDLNLQVSYQLDDDFIESFIDRYSDKTLFFTATPKNSNNIMMYESITNYNDYELIDDDDSIIRVEPDCGKMIYEYMHYTGVNDNILNDFNIRVDLYTESIDSNIFDAISRSILETGNNRVLTFHSRSHTKSDSRSNVIDFVNEDLFIKSFNKIRKTEFKHLKGKYKNITFKGITASTKDKLQILEDFDNTEDNEIYILASCKTIGEGVDTKNANMCVFIDSKQSYIEIIQNIGRICRKNNKTHGLATILIPTYVDVNKYKDCKTDEEHDIIIKNELSKTGNFNGILSVISALRQEDPYMFELCLNSPTIFTEKEIKDIVKKNNNELVDKEYSNTELFNDYQLKYNNNIDEIDNFKLLSNKLSKNIKIINKKIDNEDIDIGKYDETINFIKTENNTFMKVIGNNKLNRPNRNIKPIYHTSDEIKVLWNITSKIDIDKKIFGGYINCTVKLSSEEEWIEKLEQVKDYIEENKMRPNKRDINKKTKSIGIWLSRQRQNYKYNMKNNKIKSIFTEFIQNFKEYFISNNDKWTNNLEKVKKYIDENKKRPNCNDKNIDIKFLGHWLCHQTKNYKQNIMEDNLFNKFTEFITEYKEYLISNDDKYYDILKQVKKYIDENKKRPNIIDENEDVRIMGRWLCSQIKYYKNNMMKCEKNKKSWEEFITEYKEYFIDNKNIWLNKLNELKNYININNKRPSNSDNNKEIKSLAQFICDCHKNHKNKNNVMKDNEIQKIWENFINEYQHIFMNSKITQESILQITNKITDKQYDEWNKKLEYLKKYINENKKKPSIIDENKDIKIMARWLVQQNSNYKNNVIKDDKIIKLWEEFITEYKEYFIDNKNTWLIRLNELKKYINTNNKRPSNNDKNKEIKSLAQFISDCQKNHKNNVMKDEIKNIWEEFITEYQKYFPDNSAIKQPSKKSTMSEETINHIKILKQPQIKDHSNSLLTLSEDDINYIKNLEQKLIPIIKPSKKSTIIKPKIESIHNDTIKSRQLSEYQELSQKMSSQKSSTTNEMFRNNNDLWHEYHNAKDFSFQGYDNQDVIPINKIIKYLESRSKHKLKILDLGCGRNLIKQHFKDNDKFTITGYDYVSYNGSVECDISELPDEDESVKICVFSQSLMGSNWKKYLLEGLRVLEYNGEMIISESKERYDIIKKYLDELNMTIIKDDYMDTNRWFVIHAIKQ